MLGSALGTGLDGAIIGLVAAAGRLPHSGIIVVDILVIAVTGLAILTAVGLQCCRPYQVRHTSVINHGDRVIALDKTYWIERKELSSIQYVLGSVPISKVEKSV